MTPELRGRLVERARGMCECSCNTRVPPGEVDHFFGRARAEETETTCWVLSVRCHFEKTRNHPTSSSWLDRFIAHCKRHGYLEAAVRAEARLFFVDTRRAFARGAVR